LSLGMIHPFEEPAVDDNPAVPLSVDPLTPGHGAENQKRPAMLRASITITVTKKPSPAQFIEGRPTR